jgi:hypothetical protein
MSDVCRKPCKDVGDVVRTVNGAAVLEYGNHLPSFHEPPLGFAVRTTIQDKWENGFFVKYSLIPFVPDKNAEAVLIEIPYVRNQPAVLVQENGKRQMIAVLQDGCAVGYSLAIVINRLFSFCLESSTH